MRNWRAKRCYLEWIILCSFYYSFCLLFNLMCIIFMIVEILYPNQKHCNRGNHDNKLLLRLRKKNIFVVYLSKNFVTSCCCFLPHWIFVVYKNNITVCFQSLLYLYVDWIQSNLSITTTQESQKVVVVGRWSQAIFTRSLLLSVILVVAVHRWSFFTGGR